MKHTGPQHLWEAGKDVELDTKPLRQSIRKITYDSKTVKVLLKNNQVLEECDDA